MPLIAFIMVAIVCLALLGFACACLTGQPVQVVDRATPLGGALAPLAEVWWLGFHALVGASFIVVARTRARSRASPAVLQRFLF